MAIRLSAYDTTPCIGTNLRDILNGLEMVEKNEYSLDHVSSDVKGLVSRGSHAAHVPSFVHPILLMKKNQREDVDIFIDLRPYTRYNDRTGRVNVTYQSEYDFQLHRAELNVIWVQRTPETLRDLHALPLKLFASWGSELLRVKYSLNPLEQFRVMVLFGLFYLGNFVEDTEMEENAKVKIANLLARHLKADVREVLKIVDEVGVLWSDINGLVDQLKNESVAMSGLSLGLLYTVLSKSWFATHSEEMLAVALEHPPTWIAILLAVAQDRSYRNTTLGRLVERNRHADPDGFIRSYLGLLESGRPTKDKATALPTPY